MSEAKGDGGLVVVGAPLSWFVLLIVLGLLVAGVWALGKLLWAMSKRLGLEAHCG